MLLSLLASALGFFIGAKLLPGVKEHNFLVALLVAVIVALLSVTLGLFLKVLTLGLLAWGIFTILLDAILIQVADWFLKSFDVKNFWWALALAVIVALTQGVVDWIF